MITLLSHLFIKNHDDVTNPAVRRAYGQLCGIVGIALNLVLFVGKFFAGTVSGSPSRRTHSTTSRTRARRW